jgi:hypothetical protein
MVRRSGDAVNRIVETHAGTNEIRPRPTANRKLRLLRLDMPSPMGESRHGHHGCVRSVRHTLTSGGVTHG